MSTQFSFTGVVWLWNNGKQVASWHFVTVDKEISTKIKKIADMGPKKRGRGAVKVEVRIGFVTWETSIFPSKEYDAYVLPLKAARRKELTIKEGDEILVYLTLI